MVEGSEDINSVLKELSQKKPDLVEFRLDRITDLGILDIIGTTKKEFKTIATDRGIRNVAGRMRLLQMAIESGFDFVDVDVGDRASRKIIQTLKNTNSKLVVSYHDYSGTPSPNALNKVLEREKSNGGNVCKIVTTAKHPRDNLTVLRFVESNASKAKLVSFAMGRMGIPSRVLSTLYGAEFTFASLTEEAQTAEGQLSIDDLRRVWQMLGVS